MSLVRVTGVDGVVQQIYRATLRHAVRLRALHGRTLFSWSPASMCCYCTGTEGRLSAEPSTVVAFSALVAAGTVLAGALRAHSPRSPSYHCLEL